MTRLIHHLRSNAIAYLALIVALGGTSYAAVNLPAGSVGTRQLKSGSVTTDKLANGSVTQKKLDPKSIGGSVLHWASVRQDGKLIGGSRGARRRSAQATCLRVTWGTAVLSNPARSWRVSPVSWPTRRSRTPSERRSMPQRATAATTSRLGVPV